MAAGRDETVSNSPRSFNKCYKNNHAPGLVETFHRTEIIGIKAVAEVVEAGTKAILAY
jgi:hypothetical protein